MDPRVVNLSSPTFAGRRFTRKQIRFDDYDSAFNRYLQLMDKRVEQEVIEMIVNSIDTAHTEFVRGGVIDAAFGSSLPPQEIHLRTGCPGLPFF